MSALQPSACKSSGAKLGSLPAGHKLPEGLCFALVGRDMRSCTDQGSGAESCERIQKEHSVAWSVPYFKPGGSDFLRRDAQPPLTVKGAETGRLFVHSTVLHGSCK